MLAISSTRKLDLKHVLAFSLGPLPWSLATSQGALNKTAKSALLPLLECHSPVLKDDQVGRAAIIIDAMASFKLFANHQEHFEI